MYPNTNTQNYSKVMIVKMNFLTFYFFFKLSIRLENLLSWILRSMLENLLSWISRSMLENLLSWISRSMLVYLQII